jgi:hypothetical protein
MLEVSKEEAAPAVVKEEIGSKVTKPVGIAVSAKLF